MGAALIKAVSEHLRETEAMGRADEHKRDVDWLAFAIGRLGNPAAAARQLGVSPQTVYTWISGGLEKVAFGKMVRLSKLTHVPLELLAERLNAAAPLGAEQRYKVHDENPTD